MNKVVLVSLVSAMVCLSACKDKQKDSASLNLIGTWRSESLNGIELATNARTLVTFLSDTKKQMSQAKFVAEYGIFAWYNKMMGEYSYDGTNMVFSGETATSFYRGTASAIDAQSMRVHFTSYEPQSGVPVSLDDNLVYSRVADNLGYEERIIGLWEGVSITGKETYGDANHRWEYKAVDNSGFTTFVYYERDTVTKQWVAAPQPVSEYNVHGNWLATRWSREGDTLSTTYYEWWDIDEITTDTMRWSARRLDDTTGEYYKTTFTLMRVKVE